MPRRIILDVDTGTDDAVAIMLAALSPEIELLACTTVWGNLAVDNTTDNTLRVLSHIGCTDVPVYRGLNASLSPPRGTGPQTDDQSGGAMHPAHLALPSPTAQAETQPAVEWLVETLRAATEPITLVPVGPLTNIAAAIVMEPTIVDKVDEVVLMGGAHNFGNVTPSAEANIWHDPVAADIVLRAGFSRVVIVPLDATHDALITSAQSSELRDLGSPAATASADFIDQRIKAHDDSQPQPIPHSAAVHDAVCIAYLLQPDVISLHHLNVAIETTGDHAYGRTVIDLRGRSGNPPNAYFALGSDASAFFEILKQGFTMK